MDFYRKIERSVTISADKRSTVDLQVDIWSQDLNVTKFVLKLDTADSTPIDLTNAAVRVAIVYNQDGQDVKIEAAGIVEDVATQKIAYVMSDKLAGFEGEVAAGFYVTLKTGQRIDVQNVTFNMCKSLLDKDLEAATENYYQTFDDIVKDVRNQADTQKSVMLAKTNEVKSYGDTQKTAVNNIVKDVQSTGNTAKTQIGQVLPDVQSKVSAINTELAKIDENMPDLFVAYADNSTGGGFSKTDSGKLYKGYGVKNSNSPADYRWERNVEDLSTGGDNLIINGGFPTDTSGWWGTSNVRFKTATHPHYFNSNKNLFLVISNFPKEGFVGTNKFKIKRNTDYTISFIGFSGPNVMNMDVTFLGRKNGESSDYTAIKAIFSAIKTPHDKAQYYSATFNTGDNDEGYIRFDHNGSTNGNDAYMYFGEVMLVEGIVAKKYQPSSADLMLNSNPINSILTTLSAENPSTTLGGTWTQLGTESKFGSTIYYWKRTN